VTQFLHNINDPSDLRNLSIEQLPQFCEELRNFIVESVLQNGGHFSANLGTVELTTALHYSFLTPDDQLVWDVGHQAYPHKIITGRRETFSGIRKKGGISGFPKLSESSYDQFGTGHSSTSISAIVGMAEADLIKGINRHHIAVIGDGSLTAGMAWEAMNNAGVSKADVLIIINDNHMGIDPNAGALNNYWGTLNEESNNFFTDLGFRYFGPDDGHDVLNLVNRIQRIKQVQGPKIWHVNTVKGKGYLEAEKEQTKWHAVKYVKINDAISSEVGDKFQDVFGQTLLDLAKLDKLVVGVTPAMPSGSSMNILMKALPSRAYDVGIAEQHAVTFSAGLAVNGLIPFCNIYSTFLQRAYDQVIHDVCLQNLPVIFCLDRAGAVGEDGDTHHGMYDLAFLRCLPNLIIAAPSDELELRQIMYSAYLNRSSPMAIRYPKGRGGVSNWQQDFKAIDIGKGRCLKEGNTLAIICIGVMATIALDAMNDPKYNDVAIYDMRFVKPLDTALLDKVFASFSQLMTIEDGSVSGGFGSAILEYANSVKHQKHIEILGYQESIIGQGSREELLEDNGIDITGIRKSVNKLLKSF
jgi:1-deoxy-D-xylulose-5-phosphate synthase